MSYAYAIFECNSYSYHDDTALFVVVEVTFRALLRIGYRRDIYKYQQLQLCFMFYVNILNIIMIL